MKIHSIELKNELRLNGTVTGTRSSENRTYTACVVAQATEATVALDAAHKARVTNELAGYRATLDVLTKKYGMTVAEAEAWHKAATERWYNAADGLYATEKRIEEKHGLDWRARDRRDALAKADLVARGFENPYEGKYDILKADSEIRGHESALANWRAVPVGAEAVLSWHADVGNAQKALSARNGRWFSERGYALRVRTDITIRETAKRSKKADA
jgi:hypothetical protein